MTPLAPWERLLWSGRPRRLALERYAWDDIARRLAATYERLT